MSLTVQNIVDATEDNFGIESTDTSKQAFLLTKFNRDVFPVVRNIILKEDQHFFDEIGYSNIVAGTDLYRVEKDATKTAFATAKRIRKLHAIGVLLDGSDQYYRPLTNADLYRNEAQQVNNNTSYCIWGYMKQSGYIRVLDIPDTAITNGLRFDFTREYEDMALSDTIPVDADMAPVLIDGLSYKLAQKLESDQMIGYRADWIKGHKMIRGMVADFSDDDVQLDGAFE